MERTPMTMTTLEQIFAPLHQRYEVSDMGEKCLDAPIEEAREEVWRVKQARQGEIR
jgi:hypothetical protein